MNKRLHGIWKTMKSRCNNPNFSKYKNYGARGIKICESWNNFENFERWSLENGYSDELTIDRINVNKNYEPNNCRWVDYKTQARNRTDNIYISYNNETLILCDIAKKYNIDRKTLKRRLDFGWTVEDALKIKPKSRTEKVKCIENGMIFDSIKKASEFAKIPATHISRVCRKKCFTAGGFHWEYIN